MSHREYITDLGLFIEQYPPMTLGLNTTDADALVIFLDRMYFPHEAALKVQHIIGHELHAKVMAAYWPEAGPDGTSPAPAGYTELPADPKERAKYQNIMLAELAFTAVSILDWVTELRAQNVGRVRNLDMGSDAEFELRGYDTPYYEMVRKKRTQKAYAALSRAGFRSDTWMIHRTSMVWPNRPALELTAARGGTE